MILLYDVLENALIFYIFYISCSLIGFWFIVFSCYIHTLNSFNITWWHVNVCLFIWVFFSSNSRILHSYGDVTINDEGLQAYKFWSILGTHGIWALRLLKRAMPTVSWGIRLQWSSWRTRATFSFAEHLVMEHPLPDSNYQHPACEATAPPPRHVKVKMLIMRHLILHAEIYQCFYWVSEIKSVGALHFLKLYANNLFLSKLQTS